MLKIGNNNKCRPKKTKTFFYNSLLKFIVQEKNLKNPFFLKKKSNTFDK